MLRPVGPPEGRRHDGHPYNDRPLARSWLWIALLVCAPTAVLAQEGRSEWRGIQGGPAHTGDAGADAPAPPLAAVWRTPAAAETSSGPLVAAAGAVVSVRATAVVALRVDDGTEVWSVDRHEGPLLAPAVGGDAGEEVVVFAEGTEDDAGVVAVSLGDGAEVWRAGLDAEVATAVVADDATAYIGLLDGTLRALGLDDGDELWSVTLPDPPVTAPAVSDGAVVAVAEDRDQGTTRVLAYDQRSGNRRWTYRIPGFALGTATPAASGDALYLGCGDLTVRALDAGSGRVLWSEPVRDAFSPRSGVAIAGGAVFASDGGGGLYRFDADTGERAWDFQFSSTVTRGAPVAAGDVVYLSTDGGEVAAVHAERGRLVWRTRFARAVAGAMAVVDGHVIVPLEAPRAGVVALRSDPDRALVDVESPTVIRFPQAIANFALAFAVVLGGLSAVFAAVRRSAAARGVTPGRP